MPQHVGKIAAGLIWGFLATAVCRGESFSTANFVVEAPTGEFAEKVARTAEHCRKILAQEWLGAELPNWFRPCKVRVRVGQIGAGGATTFSFGGGEVFDWKMNVQGTEERILDSVIPHEVSHTIFACYFRRPIPRWADEGAATLVEHESEQGRQQRMLEQVMHNGRRIPLTELLEIREYPKDTQKLLTLYAEGHSLARYLVGRGGKKRYLELLNTSPQSGWEATIRKLYGWNSIQALEDDWHQWIMAGSPEDESSVEGLADARPQTTPLPRNVQVLREGSKIVRSQTPMETVIPPLPPLHRERALAARNVSATPRDRGSRSANGPLPVDPY